jgi:hypothetical protein
VRCVGQEKKEGGQCPQVAKLGFPLNSLKNSRPSNDASGLLDVDPMVQINPLKNNNKLLLLVKKIYILIKN